MKYLLDTSVFLWMIFGEENKLSKKSRHILEEGHELVLSAASTWEIAIKYSLGKLQLKERPHLWLPNIIFEMGLIPLPISHKHSLAVTQLPDHHRDPFDRILVAQSKTEGLPLISPDKTFKKYKTDLVW
ncbi:MAG: type II toxin-antitoxin system VapC family toxin [Deltaproteobacteria bacterium]|nr:type II toxin-antitoxin system VapC family toxin [Deltaproteobacteria bacterium]